MAAQELPSTVIPDIIESSLAVKSDCFSLQSCSSGTEVGSTRAFGVGPARLFEQLTALDDVKHRL